MTKHVLSILLFAPVLLVAGDWEWSLGLNVRGFDDIALDAFELNDGAFIDGAIDELGGGFWRYAVKAPLMQVTGMDLDEVTYRTASLGTKVDGIDHGHGVALGMKRALWESGTIRVALGLSFTAAGTTSGQAFSAAQEVETWSIATDSWNAGTVPDSGQLTKVSGNHTEIAGLGTSNASVMVRYDLDFGIYTFGAGLVASHGMGRARASIASGPTLSLVDYDVSRDAYGASTDGSVFYTEETSDDGLTCRAGWYARIGCTWELTEAVLLSAGLRYDWIPVDLNTDIADMGLSGPAAEAGLTLRF